MNGRAGQQVDRRRGFVLLETLVALAILSFGLLGGLTMLIAGLRASREAMQRTAAVTLAADLAERIRANRSAGIAYDLPSDKEPVAPDSACSATTPCEATARAAQDLYEWRQRVADALPGAASRVAVQQLATAAASVVTIEIRWLVPGSPGERLVTLRLLA
ncbi:MAG: type IV pilus modification protein PilV [Steroidobacteraceae bacterium]